LQQDIDTGQTQIQDREYIKYLMLQALVVQQRIENKNRPKCYRIKCSISKMGLQFDSHVLKRNI